MIDKILEAYKTYIKGTKLNKNGTYSQWYGSKDSVSVNVMHDAIAEVIREIVEENGLAIRTSNIGEGGEYQLDTGFHKKKIDIAIVDPHTEELVLAISFKMPMSSIARNLSTMIEGNLGDTVLIKDAGIPMAYVFFADATPITKKADQFRLDTDPKNNISQLFKEKMAIKRTNKYRSDLLFINVFDFGDKEFKASQEGMPFSKEREKKVIAERHLSWINENVDIDNISVQTLGHDGVFYDNFEESLLKFVEAIKLTIHMHNLRKNHF